MTATEVLMILIASVEMVAAFFAAPYIFGNHSNALKSEKVTVQEWRKRNRKCKFCKHLQYLKIPPNCIAPVEG